MRSGHLLETSLCFTVEVVSVGTRLYVHLAPTLDVPSYRRRWESGAAPDATPYGFHLAASLGWSVRFSRARVPRRRPWQGILGLVDRLTGGVDLWHAWRNRASVRGAQMIWTLTDAEGLALAVLMRIGLLPRRPLIAGTVWMLHEWDQHGRVKRAVLRWSTRAWTVLTVHAEPCLQIARRELRSADSRLLRFGVSDSAFPLLPPLERSERSSGPLVVFAMGNDRTRDWDVLLEAFGDDERFRIDLVCRWFTEERAGRYGNVRLIRDPDLEQMRRLYRESDYAAIPMRENAFSGITVALEAAALGVPVLGSRTGGLLTYFTEDEMLLSPVGDATSMREAVLGQGREERRAMAERAQRRTEAGRYTTQGLVERYDRIASEVLAEQG